MATPMPHDVHDHDPFAGKRANRPPHERTSPDEEAMHLMTKVLERALVAKSFAKLAGGLLTVSAAQATLQLRAVADAKLAEVKRVARAATEAALHVATKPKKAPSTDEAPETEDAPVTHQAAE